jgi:recombination protein RecA
MTITMELNDETKKKLDLAMAAINKEYGAGSIMRMDADATMWPSVSTGAATLDLALGIGGVPLGRIIEIFGPESSGKTSLAASIVAEAQKKGMVGAFVDVECALDPIYMGALGVNVDDLLISQPDYGEQALNIVESLIRTEVVKVIVVDSVAALTPLAELENPFEQQSVGQLPRLMSKAMRKFTSLVSQYNVCLIFINQIREKVGVMFGNPETTPGGRALPFHASIRIDVRKESKPLKDSNGEPNGVHVKAKIIKNKLAPPYRVAEYDIIYGKGIDKVGCLLDLAVMHGIFTKSGSYYVYGGESYAQGRPNTIDKLSGDTELLQKVKDTINAQ